jgi:mRNA-degrading endonuclease YafQ of YafQ-DinJ toxin-antitoxin module
MLVFGFEVSQGLIPQGPVLFLTETSRDAAFRDILQERLRNEDWRDLIQATAEGNFVEHELPADWTSRWDMRTAIDWLLGFSFIGNGDDFELRSFEAEVTW